MSIKSRMVAEVTFPDIDAVRTFKPSKGTVTLDANRIPYVEARFTIPAPEEAFLAQVDPRDGLRIVIAATRERIDPADTDQTRTFDLLLHERTYDPVAGTLELIGWSDEALLIDGGPLDIPYYADLSLLYSSSLRAMVNKILGDFYGTALEAGATDADFTETSSWINQYANPSYEVAADYVGTAGANNVSAFARSNTVGGYTGSWACRMTVNTAAAASMYFTVDSAGSDNLWNVTEGERIFFGLRVRSGTAGRSCQVRLRLYKNPDGTGTTLDILGTAVTSTTTGWTEVTVSAAIPTGYSSMRLMLTIAANTAGQLHYMDAVQMFRLPSLQTPRAPFVPSSGSPLPTTLAHPAPFTGSDSPDAYYTYAWEGTAHASRSSKVSITGRPENYLRVYPGTNWWDFLSPLLQASELRLFCDEQRKWYLVDNTYTVPGTITVEEGTNLLDGSDRISLEATDAFGDPLWATAVVVEYNTRDDGDLYDIGGGSSAQKVVKFDGGTTYPGAGAGQTRYIRLATRGRLQPVSAVADLDATPLMAAATQIPDVPAQEGRIAAVTFAWSAEGDDHDTMTLVLDGLEDA